MEEKVPTAEEACAFQSVIDLYKTKVNLCRSWHVDWVSIELEYVPSTDGLIDELRKQIDTHWVVKVFDRIQFSDKEKYPNGPMLSFGPCDCLTGVRPARFENVMFQISRSVHRTKYVEAHSEHIARMRHEPGDMTRD